MEANKKPLENILARPYFFPGLLLLILIPLYIYCLPPGLPPYRDSGEMASAAATLGVAHQPGYPLYIISAKLFSLIPLGNPAWRLNLFSAAAGLSGIEIRTIPEFVQTFVNSADPLYARIRARLPEGTSVGDFVTSAEIVAVRPRS